MNISYNTTNFNNNNMMKTATDIYVNILYVMYAVLKLVEHMIKHQTLETCRNNRDTSSTFSARVDSDRLHKTNQCLKPIRMYIMILMIRT